MLIFFFFFSFFSSACEFWLIERIGAHGKQNPDFIIIIFIICEFKSLIKSSVMAVVVCKVIIYGFKSFIKSSVIAAIMVFAKLLSMGLNPLSYHLSWQLLFAKLSMGLEDQFE